MTSNHLRRMARTLAGVVLVAVGLAAGASQATMGAEPAFPGSAVFSEQGGVRIVGGDADSAIETEIQSDGTIVITDPAGVSAANDPFPEDGFGCMAIDSTRARCDFPSDGGLDAFLGPATMCWPRIGPSPGSSSGQEAAAAIPSSSRWAPKSTFDSGETRVPT